MWWEWGQKGIPCGIISSGIIYSIMHKKNVTSIKVRKAVLSKM